MAQIIELTPQILGQETIKKSTVDEYLDSQDFHPKWFPTTRPNSFLVVDTKQYWTLNNPALNAPIHHYKYLDLPSHHNGAYYVDSLLFWKPNITASNIEDEISLHAAFKYFERNHICRNNLENINILPINLELLRSLIHTNQVSQGELSTVAKYIILPGEYYISQTDYIEYPTMCINKYEHPKLIHKPFFSFSENSTGVIHAFGKPWGFRGNREFPKGYFHMYNTAANTFSIVSGPKHNTLQRYAHESSAYLFMKIDSLQRFYGKF